MSDVMKFKDIKPEQYFYDVKRYRDFDGDSMKKKIPYQKISGEDVYVFSPNGGKRKTTITNPEEKFLLYDNPEEPLTKEITEYDWLY